MSCRNWECGVIVPVVSKIDGKDQGSSRVGDGSRPAREDMDGMDVFRGVVPVPMKHPGRAMDGREPWFFSELDEGA